MTDAEWLASNNPHQMFKFLVRHRKRTTSDRKWLLLSCSLCRRLWDCIEDERWHQAIEFMEMYADDPSRQEELWALQNEVGRSIEELPRLPFDPADWTGRLMAPDAVGILIGEMPQVAAEFLMVRVVCVMMNEGRREEEDRFQCDLFRDIFGNPFRTIAVNSRWQSPTVAGLARTIYDERALELLPILADALEEAGCGNLEILSHLRDPGPHVRGCWALDLVLGKE